MPGEDVLELHHAGVGEHQRRVVARHQRRGGHDAGARSRRNSRGRWRGCRSGSPSGSRSRGGRRARSGSANTVSVPARRSPSTTRACRGAPGRGFLGRGRNPISGNAVHAAEMKPFQVIARISPPRPHRTPVRRPPPSLSQTRHSPAKRAAARPRLGRCPGSGSGRDGSAGAFLKCRAACSTAAPAPIPCARSPGRLGRWLLPRGRDVAVLEGPERGLSKRAMVSLKTSPIRPDPRSELSSSFMVRLRYRAGSEPPLKSIVSPWAASSSKPRSASSGASRRPMK